MWIGLLPNAVNLDIGGLISLIVQTAQTAQQNRQECQHLARRVGLLAEVVPRLQQDPEVRRAAAGLEGALVEAHRLIMDCQRKRLVSQLLSASRTAGRFADVHRKIETYLAVFPLLSHLAIARRLDANPLSSAQRSQSSHLLVLDRSGGAEEDLEYFTLSEIAVATSNFAVVLSADEDSGTKVYRGRLRDGTTEVAVKRLSPRTRRGAKDAFFAERHILAPLRHAHIVRLLGTCADDGERMLVTQYMPNGTLHDHLHCSSPSKSSSPVTASWRARVQVLLGAARAVEHLHCRAVPLVIHGNVASPNLLLDAAWAPRLSGFGRPVWRAAGVASQPVNELAGGGYADPECRSTGHIKPASDVYGLGVVMLEVLTGQPAVVSVWDEVWQKVVTMALASFALPNIQGGTLRDALDRRPAPWPTTWQQLQPLQMVADTATRCLNPHGDSRPAISDVVANLEQALRLM